MFNYLLFVAGFFFLIKGADLLIKGASAISKKYKISEITIGMSVVALGTSLPELVVNIFASINGEHDLIIGNIAGSNIANTFLVLGVGALFATLYFSVNTQRIDIPYSLLSVFSLLFFIFLTFFIFGDLVLSKFSGIIFLLLFGLYLKIIFTRKHDFIEAVESLKPRTAWLYVLFGSAGLFFGGEFVVDGAVRLSEFFGFSTMFIGSSLIAFGTALPELVTIIISVKKNKNDLAIGNIVGSNIFNILLVLGVSSLISPVIFTGEGVLNFLFVALSLLVLMFFILWSKIKCGKYLLNKWHGLVFLFLYLVYLIIIF